MELSGPHMCTKPLTMGTEPAAINSYIKEHKEGPYPPRTSSPNTASHWCGTQNSSLTWLFTSFYRCICQGRRTEYISFNNVLARFITFKYLDMLCKKYLDILYMNIVCTLAQGPTNDQEDLAKNSLFYLYFVLLLFLASLCLKKWRPRHHQNGKRRQSDKVIIFPSPSPFI